MRKIQEKKEAVSAAAFDIAISSNLDTTLAGCESMHEKPRNEVATMSEKVRNMSVAETAAEGETEGETKQMLARHEFKTTLANELCDIASAKNIALDVPRAAATTIGELPEKLFELHAFIPEKMKWFSSEVTESIDDNDPTRPATMGKTAAAIVATACPTVRAIYKARRAESDKVMNRCESTAVKNE